MYEYVTPCESPESVNDRLLEVATNVPSLYTLYEVAFCTAFQDTKTFPPHELPATAKIVGAIGGLTQELGVVMVTGSERAESPALLLAFTV